MAQDPTREEMLSFIMAEISKPSWFLSEFDEFDIEEAIYWFSADNHSGQFSNLYSALSRSPYHPGPSTRSCETHASRELYSVLCDGYCN